MVFKKIINDPYKVVDEMVDGIVLAHQDILKFANNKRAVVRKDAPVKDKVGILIGGGSGHEPAFVGYVGKGLADGAAIGNVFASPSPDPVVDATKAISGGKGVVYIYSPATHTIRKVGLLDQRLIKSQSIFTTSIKARYRLHYSFMIKCRA